MEKIIKTKISIFLLLTSLLIPLSLFAEEEPNLITIPEKSPIAIPLDNSIEITFSPPLDHIEKPEIAKKNGMQKFYLFPTTDSNFSISYFSVAYTKEEKGKNLQEHVHINDIYMKKICPDATTALLVIDRSDVTHQFDQLNIPYTATITTTNKEGYPDLCAFYFETKEGFWTITWNAPIDLIHKGKDVFLDFIKNIKINRSASERDNL